MTDIDTSAYDTVALMKRMTEELSSVADKLAADYRQHKELLDYVNEAWEDEARDEDEDHYGEQYE